VTSAAAGSRGPQTEIVIIRHAQTAWSVARRHTGRTDIPLTDEGRAAAQALGPALADREFALVLASPLSRATETASLAGLDPEPEPDLMEWDYGDYEGRSTADIREERPGWFLWRDGVPGGESADDVAARADRVIQRVLDPDGPDGDVALVAHGHLLRVLAARWLEQPAAFGARLALGPAHLGVLGFERETRALLRWGAGS
jgi:probable phosphoglycerate mutase